MTIKSGLKERLNDRRLWRATGAVACLVLLAAIVVAPRLVLPVLALLCGALFFLYGLKSYASVAIIMLSTTGANGNGNGNGHGNGKGNGNGGRNGLVNRLHKGNGHHPNGGNGKHFKLPPDQQPFISIQLPMYNENRVVDRLLTACTGLDYENYEVLVADDSSDQTLHTLERWAKHPKVRVSHRINRSGFKGAALKHASEVMNPKAEFVAVFDADFIPPPDILHQFLSYFYGVSGSGGNGNGNGHGQQGNGDSNRAGGNGHNGSNGNGLYLLDESLAVVQGYQWHVLNASENWITRGIRAEFAGSYVIERSTQELTGGMKMISGSVFMIRADVLREHEWGTSITEDWELTLRLYLDGYKVLYTPFIQAPAECVSDFKQLARQRMRWAEGHTFNVKRFFLPVLRSPNLSRREKLEFIYYAPYYLTSVLFIFGTAAWLISELFLRVELPYWSELFGWSLVFTNAFALILMNLAGLFQERGVRRSWAGLFSFALLTFLLVPYQAYAALKGLLEPREGGWHRTRKSGVVTDVVKRMGLARRMPKLMPKKKNKGFDLAKRLPAVAKLSRWVPQPVRALATRSSLAARLASGLVGAIAILGLMARSVNVVSAAPDSFYLHDSAKSGVTPAGKQMNNTLGSVGSTLAFDTVGQDAYWYSELSYPTGNDDGGIGAGAYTANLYFSQLPTSGPPTFDAGSVQDGGSSATNNLTWSHTVTSAGSNRILIVGVAINNSSSQTVSGVTYGGVSLTQVPGGTATQGTLARAELWYLTDPPTGANDVVVTLSADAVLRAGAASYTGVDQTTPLGTANGANNRSGTASVNVSSATGELVVDVVAVESTSATISAGANQTSRYESDTGSTNIRLGGSEEAGAATVTMSWPISSTKDWAIVGVPLKPAGSGSVDVTVYVHHTAADGSGETLITSASTTITSGTANPLALGLGSGSQQTFSTSNPRLLRAWVEVTGVSGGGSFTLAYDSAADPSGLDTPVVTVPEWTAAFLLAVPLIPYLMSFLWKRRRSQLAWQLVGLFLALGLSVALLATQVQSVTAAPDTFYFHPAATSGITPAGEYMNNTEGSAGSTKAFNTASQDAYWYADVTWPTGNDNASIAAGAYTLNMYFANRPGAGSGDYPAVATTNTSFNDTLGTSHTVNLPSGIQSGNLLIVIFGFKGGTNQTITWPNGYTSFFRSDRLTNVGVEAAYRQADGSEGSTITVQTSANSRSTHNSYRITGAADPATRAPESAASNGNNTNPDPPSLTPTGGAKDYLWIALEINNNGTTTITAFPTNYSGGIQANGASTNSTTGSAVRQVNAASEDPGTFTIPTSIAWAAGTLVVHPAASVDIQVTVAHTAADGSGATTIVTSSTTTINASTADPYALSIGSGSAQTFTSSDPRRLRVRVNVVSVNSGGDFTLDYDGTCASSKCSNLDTPVVTVPEFALVFLPVALLIPVAVPLLKKRRTSPGLPGNLREAGPNPNPRPVEGEPDRFLVQKVGRENSDGQ